MTKLLIEESVVRQALEAWKAIETDSDECLDFDECTAMLVPLDTYHQLDVAITALRDAIENQPKVEPYRWYSVKHSSCTIGKAWEDSIPLYTHHAPTVEKEQS